MNFKAVYVDDITSKIGNRLDEESKKILDEVLEGAPDVSIPRFKNGIYIKQKAMQIMRELVESMEANKDKDSVPEDDILAVKEAYNIILMSPVEEPEKPEEDKKEEPKEDLLETPEVQEEEPVEEVEEESVEEKEEVEE